MHLVSTTPTSSAPASALEWHGYAVERGDASSIAKLTKFKRNYVDKVLRGTRKSEAIESAALRFFNLRKELRG